MFTASATLDWGSPIQGSITGSNSGGLGQALTSTYPQPDGTTLNAAVDGDAFTIASNDQLERADNTDLAWSSTFNAWVPASIVNSNNIYFSGNFGAPNTPTSQPQFGDNLLGAIAPSGNSNGAPTITLTFQHTLSYVAFQVSSKTQANFTAELLAFDSQGNQLGTYMVQDTGDGGNCAGLNNSPPQPCDSAPLIQFYDAADNIASVELVMENDTTGVFIDELEVSPVPEPVTFWLIATGLILTVWMAKRKRRAGQVIDPRD